jgi:hypothetical protein
MNEKTFTYENYEHDAEPSVLVTSENQHTLQGFNINYMTKGQATRIRNEWKRVAKQNWALSTKVRVVMNRVGKPAKQSYRTYRKEYISL